MRRSISLLLGALLTAVIAAPAAADTAPLDSYQVTGFSTYSSECGRLSCTDTYVYADIVVAGGTSTADVCVERFTYSIRGGRGSGAFGCAPASSLTVARDLSAATLGTTSVELCGRPCTTVTVAAELVAIAGASSFRARSVSRDGTCTYTYTASGSDRLATGTLTLDGVTLPVVEAFIRQYEEQVTVRCR